MGKLFDFFRNIFEYKEKFDYDFVLSNGNTEPNENISDITETVSSSYDYNIELIKTKYSTLINSDIKIREFNLNFQNKQYKSFIFYIDGMINSDSINRFVLSPLMSNISSYKNSNVQNSNKVSIIKNSDISSYIIDSLLPQNDITQSNKFSEIFSLVNLGNTALFIDSVPYCFLIDAKGFDKRSIPVPENEFVIRGSQEGFIETVRTNTSLLRRLINNENLIIESTSVGRINKNTVCICYMKNIANSDLVNEVKYRVNNLDIDYIISSGELEQFITDKQFGIPQMISTERPDRVANYLLDGRVALIVNGTPYVLVAPAVFLDFLTSSEDRNLQYQFSNLLRLIRAIALVITLILPGFYISITTFHQELIPTELLFAIVSTRSSVPFPIIFEIILMDLSLELIRESGVRVPAPMGQTIGIVGGLILGDAAVSADIVSPILIIVVAITGLTAFAVPDYSLGFHIRIARLFYIFAGYFAGFFGLAFAMFIHLGMLASINSFGVSYLSPYAPFSVSKSESYMLDPIWKRERRDSFLNTKLKDKESHISMKWKGFVGK